MGIPRKIMEAVATAQLKYPDISNIRINLPPKVLARYSEAQQAVIKLAIRAWEQRIAKQTASEVERRRGYYNSDDTGMDKTWEGNHETHCNSTFNPFLFHLTPPSR